MMANCHDLFKDFYGKIELASSKKKYLKEARDAIRDKIREYFKDTLKTSVPKFLIQGSYAMATIVNPLDGEFDIDDGVYLQNLQPDKSKWPKPETVHNWIYKAVEGHTKEKAQDKRTCVRVVYSGNYHVDLPIYGVYNKNAYLAEKAKLGWHISEPQKIVNWLRNQIKSKGDQLRRLIRYTKAWADYQSKSGELPNGFTLTVLVAEGYEKSERDDSSFAGTMRNISDRISASTVILNPVDQNEDLGKRISESQMKNFKERLAALLENASAALKEKSKVKACKKWKSEFGERFPKCEDLKEVDTPRKTAAPAILRDDARSA